MKLQTDLTLLAFRAANYALNDDPDHTEDELRDWLIKQAELTAESIEKLIDNKISKALAGLQEGGYIPI